MYARLVQKYKITHREHSVATDDDMEFATIRNVKWTENGSVRTQLTSLMRNEFVSCVNILLLEKVRS